MNVFLSYSSHNAEFAYRLRQALWSIGIITIETNLKETAGAGIIDNLDKVLPNIDYIVVVFSQAYNRDEWLESELMAFVGKSQAAGHEILIPIQIEDCHIPYVLRDKIRADFRSSFEKGIEELLAYIARQRQAFVVMKLGNKELDSAFDGAIQVVGKEFGYSVLRVDKIQDSDNVTVQILREISKSEIVVADLTHDSPNCYYEVGYAHGLRKEIILTRRTGAGIPFDLAGNRFIVWETEGDLREGLRERFGAIRARARQSIPPPISLRSGGTRVEEKPGIAKPSAIEIA
ncbi:MAG TPA: toll/interleukin-1 receptor domain-containing protein [Thermoanaerobaculia bacterium]